MVCPLVESLSRPHQHPTGPMNNAEASSWCYANKYSSTLSADEAEGSSRMNVSSLHGFVVVYAARIPPYLATATRTITPCTNQVPFGSVRFFVQRGNQVLTSPATVQ